MDCFHPRTIRLFDGRSQVVRCDRCLACLAYRQGGWLVRLRQEMQDRGGAYFATLTYDDEHLPMFRSQDWRFIHDEPVPAVSKRDIQKFHMDMRKRFQQGFYMDDSLVPFGGKVQRIDLSTFTRFSFYLTSELGPEGKRPHYHGIYFGLPEDPFLVANLFNKIWYRGFTMVEPAQTTAAAAYVSKYLVNDSFVPPPSEAPDYPRMFSLMSKGLGKGYLSPKMMDWHRSAPLQRCFHPNGKDREILPRYWKDRLFDDDMKASLLDKSVELAEARQAALNSMDEDSRLLYLEDLNHSEEEAVRQAEWRFRKTGKLK